MRPFWGRCDGCGKRVMYPEQVVMLDGTCLIGAPPPEELPPDAESAWLLPFESARFEERQMFCRACLVTRLDPIAMLGRLLEQGDTT